VILRATLIAQMTLFQNIWPEASPLPEPIHVPPPISFGEERDQDCQPPDGGNIFGETAFVRGEYNLPPITDDMALKFAAARMSNDLGHIRTLMDPILDQADGTPAIAPRIELAMNLLRFYGAETGDLREKIDSLFAPLTAFSPYSDYHYIQALLAQSSGDRNSALAHLEEALSINPDFYNAVQLRSILIMSDMDVAFRDTGDCQDLLLGLKAGLSSVAILGSCPMQLAHFQLALGRFLPTTSSPQRHEVLALTEIAISYIARKDDLHRQLLTSYYGGNRATSQLCAGLLQQLDFGSGAK
tara:strand:+ start:909 stop:1805 length:897 start_codon:yes stop_codon:yes gene_type:complete